MSVVSADTHQPNNPTSSFNPADEIMLDAPTLIVNHLVGVRLNNTNVHTSHLPLKHNIKQYQSLRIMSTFDRFVLLFTDSNNTY